MTTSHAEKSRARELVALTGESYQACLTAVRVLGPLSDRIDLGDLTPLMTGAKAPRALALPTDPDQVRELRAVLELFSPTCESCVATDSADGESRVLIPVLAEGSSVLFDLPLEPQLRPAGPWAFQAAELERALEIVNSSADPTVVVRAVRADEASLPPEDAPLASLSDQLLVVEPVREPGPGFDWCWYSFESVGMIDTGDHSRECGDEGLCGYLHDWPATDPDAAGFLLPSPLLSAYRSLVTPDALGNCFWSNELRVHMADCGTGRWYGVDLPTIARLWMRVPGQGPRLGQSPAAP